jgi:hypothetical protein
MSPIFRYHPNLPVAFTLSQHSGIDRHLRAPSRPVKAHLFALRVDIFSPIPCPPGPTGQGGGSGSGGGQTIE